MTLASFSGWAEGAAARAIGTGLTLDDLRIIARCVRAWDARGRPDSGRLAECQRICWRIYRHDALRESKALDARNAEILRLANEIDQIERERISERAA